MDFTFTDDQATLRDSVERHLARNYSFDVRQAHVRSSDPLSVGVWKGFSDLGLLELPFPESVGGLGGSIVDLVAISEPFGENLLVEPYLPSILLAGRALAAAPEQPVAGQWLGRLMSGEALGALAHEEGRGTAELSQVGTRCRPAGEGYRLDGHKRLVLSGADADVLVVTARETGEPGDPAGLVLLAVEAGTEGVQVTPFRTVDGRRAAHIDFNSVKVPVDHVVSRDPHAALSVTLRDAVIVLAAEAVGAMSVLLRSTSEYATTRHQFGAPLASFQAVAHRLADMKIAHTKARATLMYTAALAEADIAAPRDISLLKAQVGRLGRAMGEAAVQLHGGVGTTDELAIGHYLKRLLTIDALFGDSDFHLRSVGAGVASEMSKPSWRLNRQT